MFQMQVWNGTDWEIHGITLEFPAHKNAEVIYPLDISNVNTDNLTIRFKSLPNESNISFLYADYSQDRIVDIEDIPLVSAFKNTTNVSEIVENVDNDRLPLATGEEVDLLFSKNLIDVPEGKNVTYFMNLTGYYRAHSEEIFPMNESEIHTMMNTPDYTLLYVVPRIQEYLDTHHSIHEDYVEVQVTTGSSNNAPVLSYEVPDNESTSISTSTNVLNVTIEDPDGDSFNWTIETNPDVGNNKSDWWDANYGYRKTLNISNSGSALSSFQVNYTFNHNSLVTASKSRADGYDIRIIDNNGNEVARCLDNDSSWNNANTQIWFNVTVGAGADLDYYMYYGNSSESDPGWDGSDVFLFWDDFSGSLGDKWNEHEQDAASDAKITNGDLHFDTNTGSAATGCGVSTKKTFAKSGGYIISFEYLRDDSLSLIHN